MPFLNSCVSAARSLNHRGVSGWADAVVCDFTNALDDFRMSGYNCSLRTVGATALDEAKESVNDFVSSCRLWTALTYVFKQFNLDLQEVWDLWTFRLKFGTAVCCAGAGLFTFWYVQRSKLSCAVPRSLEFKFGECKRGLGPHTPDTACCTNCCKFLRQDGILRRTGASFVLKLNVPNRCAACCKQLALQWTGPGFSVSTSEVCIGFSEDEFRAIKLFINSSIEKSSTNAQSNFVFKLDKRSQFSSIDGWLDENLGKFMNLTGVAIEERRFSKGIPIFRYVESQIYRAREWLCYDVSDKVWCSFFEDLEPYRNSACGKAIAAPPDDDPPPPSKTQRNSSVGSTAAPSSESKRSVLDTVSNMHSSTTVAGVVGESEGAQLPATIFHQFNGQTAVLALEDIRRHDYSVSIDDPMPRPLPRKVFENSKQHTGFLIDDYVAEHAELCHFYKHKEGAMNREFSNFYPVDSIMRLPYTRENFPTFVKCHCSEQAIMACKAQYFDDLETFNAIMGSTEPYEVKALGRTVRGFDQTDWDYIIEQVAFVVAYHKYYDQHCYNTLMSTCGLYLCESTSKDVIWGTGCDIGSPGFDDPSTWPGTNYLGKSLTRLREYFHCLTQACPALQTACFLGLACRGWSVAEPGSRILGLA